MERTYYTPIVGAETEKLIVRPPHHGKSHESESGGSDDREHEIGLWWGGIRRISSRLDHCHPHKTRKLTNARVELLLISKIMIFPLYIQTSFNRKKSMNFWTNSPAKKYDSSLASDCANLDTKKEY